MNVGRVADPAVDGAPERVALAVDGHSWTYGELEDLVSRCAAALSGAGVGSGDRVALVDEGSALSVATILAAARIGAASAQFNVQLKVGEMRQLAELVGARVGVAGDAYASALAAALGTAVLGVADVLEADGAAFRSVAVGDDDEIALILFTSGTTGLPKPVYISHRVVTGRLRYYAAPFDASEEQLVDMLSAPVYHIGGTLGLLITLHAGRKMVILPRFSAREWLHLVEEHGVSQTFLVPTMLQRILDDETFADTDLRSLRGLSYGAAAAPVELVRRAVRALPHVDFTNVFGQTETLGAYAALLPDDHRAERKLGSAGRLFPGVEMVIVAVGTEDPVPPGTPGEVLVRAAQNVTADWLRTGDLARMDEEGYIYPTGRLSDTINRGGEKFGPAEIEEVLRMHPAVADVGVAGVPDPELGERVGALVVLRSPWTADELKTHCREHLARFKVPERIAFTDALPYNDLGKLSRKALAEAIVSEHATA